MADSDIVVSGLVATPGIGHIALQYSTDEKKHDKGLLNLALDVVEVWAAQSAWSAESQASKVAEGNKTGALHVALLEGTTWYYRVKPKNRQGFYGDFHPALGSSAVQATVGFAASATQALINGKLVITVAANAVTGAIKTLSGDDASELNPITVRFRSATLSDSAPVFRKITSALSLTLPSGATAGFTASDPSRLWWCLFDVGDGSVKLTGRNCSTPTAIFALPEFGLATTVLNNTSADSAGVFYADTVLTNRPFRILGFSDWSSGLATPGTWNVNPDLVHMFGPGIPKPGDLIQTSRNESGAQLSLTGTAMTSTQVPTTSMGTQAFTVSITPISSVNLLVHDTAIMGQLEFGGAPVLVVIALFEPGVSSSAFVGGVFTGAGADEPVEVFVRTMRRARGATQKTFTMRGGTPSGSNNPFLMNSSINGDLMLGGIAASYYEVSERMG